MRTTKEDVEGASGEREQECWFGEKGCHQSNEMESGSWRDCCQSGVNQATPVLYRIKIGLIGNVNHFENMVQLYANKALADLLQFMFTLVQSSKILFSTNKNF